MSWKKILKKVSIDMQEGTKACCEVARGELMELFQDAIERYKQEGKLDVVKTIQTTRRIVDKIGCNALKNGVKNLMSTLEEDALGKPYNVRFKEILEDWDECESDAEKVKDDLKEKPEGFNPEEPYGSPFWVSNLPHWRE